MYIYMKQHSNSLASANMYMIITIKNMLDIIIEPTAFNTNNKALNENRLCSSLFAHTQLSQLKINLSTNHNSNGWKPPITGDSFPLYTHNPA